MPTYATAIANVIWKCFCCESSAVFFPTYCWGKLKNSEIASAFYCWCIEHLNFKGCYCIAQKYSTAVKWSPSRKENNKKTCWILHQNSTHWWQKMRSYWAAVAQNISKKLQHAYQKTNDRLIELARQQHRLEQYSRREWLDITGIPRNINKKDFKKLLFFWWDWSQAQWKWNHLPQTG